MQKTIDYLGEQEARAAGLMYKEYCAQLQRFAKREEPKPKVMAATAGR